jgi:hypothetical protein
MLWVKPVILPTPEGEIQRIVIKDQFGQCS